jgi:serine/threonine protein kinase
MLVEGQQFGPYTIEAAIGAGGMGEVYRARDTRLDRHVAIKLLPADRDKRVRLAAESCKHSLSRTRAGHDDYFRGSAFFNTASQDVQPSDSWQLNVQQDDPEVVFLYLLQRCRTIVRVLDREPGASEQLPQPVPRGVIVINNQHIEMGHQPSQNSAARSRKGSRGERRLH